MLTTQQALWQSILRTPKDRALLMAFADSLIEEGHPDGEKLRIVLGIADGSIPKHKHDSKAVYEFIAYDITLWEMIGGVNFPVRFGWDLGIPTICTLRWDHYLRYCEGIAREFPITEWNISNYPDEFHVTEGGFSIQFPTQLSQFSEEFRFKEHHEAMEFLNEGLYYFARRNIYEDRGSDDIERFVSAIATKYARPKNFREHYGGDTAPAGERGRTGLRNWQ